MVTIYLVKVFTQNKNEGNPAGVIIDTNTLSDPQMQKIASSLQFSESVFVFPSQKADFKFRYFSPHKEVSICVHATLAAAHVLRAVGKVKRRRIKIETNNSTLSVEYGRQGFIRIEFVKKEFFNREISREEIASLLSIKVNEMATSCPLQIVSIGSPKLIIPIKSFAILQKIKPNLPKIKKWCQKYNATGFYPFTTQTIEKSSTFHARQFNPLAGISEDPITGIAAGALGVYALKYGQIKKKKIVIEQGYSVNKPGKVYVEVGKIIKVGGYVVKYGKKNLS